MKRRSTVSRRNDAMEKAARTIAAAGWLLTVSSLSSPRYVAIKRVNEDDGSTTRLFESSYGLEDLARIVLRREREEVGKRVKP